MTFKTPEVFKIQWFFIMCIPFLKTAAFLRTDPKELIEDVYTYDIATTMSILVAFKV